MSIAVVLIRCFTTVICCGCTTFVVVDSNMYGGGNQSYTRIIVAACHRHQLTSNFNRASLTTTSTVQTSWRSAFVLTACGPIHSQRALGNHMLPCFRLQRILPILLGWPYTGIALHMSFTYCIFCKVCELWPRSSLQEIVEHKLDPLLYWCQRSQQDRIWLPALCLVSEYLFNGVKFSTSAKQNPNSCAKGC